MPNKIKKSFIKYLNSQGLILLFVFLLSACSSYPSEVNVKEAIENSYKNLVKVVSFKKINAQKGELAGIKFYEMEYSAVIEYLDDVVVTRAMGKTMEIRKGKRNPYMILEREVKKGTQEKIKGKLTFESTEKGWKGEDNRIYSHTSWRNIMLIIIGVIGGMGLLVVLFNIIISKPSAIPFKKSLSAEKESKEAYIYCTQCGHKNGTTSNFCQECGSKLE